MTRHSPAPLTLFIIKPIPYAVLVRNGVAHKLRRKFMPQTYTFTCSDKKIFTGVSIEVPSLDKDINRKSTSFSLSSSPPEILSLSSLSPHSNLYLGCVYSSGVAV